MRRSTFILGAGVIKVRYRLLALSWWVLTAVLGAAMTWPAVAAEMRFERETVAFTLDNGREIQAELHMPVGTGPADGPVPAVMLFAGFEAAGRVLELVEVPAPVALVSFDYPFDPPRRFGGVMRGLSYLPQARDAIHMTLEGIGHLHTALGARPDIDAERIVIAGVSLGAPFAVVSAARHDIPNVAIIHGFGEPHSVIERLLARRLAPRIGALAGPTAWGLARFMVWYGRLPNIPAHAEQLHAHQNVLVIDAQDDHIVTEPALNSLHTALAASAARVTYANTAGGHVDEGADERIADILSRMLSWMQSEGLAAQK